MNPLPASARSRARRRAHAPVAEVTRLRPAPSPREATLAGPAAAEIAAPEPGVAPDPCPFSILAHATTHLLGQANRVSTALLRARDTGTSADHEQARHRFDRLPQPVRGAIKERVEVELMVSLTRIRIEGGQSPALMPSTHLNLAVAVELLGEFLGCEHAALVANNWQPTTVSADSAAAARRLIHVVLGRERPLQARLPPFVEGARPLYAVGRFLDGTTKRSQLVARLPGDPRVEIYGRPFLIAAQARARGLVIVDLVGGGAPASLLERQASRLRLKAYAMLARYDVAVAARLADGEKPVPVLGYSAQLRAGEPGSRLAGFHFEPVRLGGDGGEEFDMTGSVESGVLAAARQVNAVRADPTLAVFAPNPRLCAGCRHRTSCSEARG